MAQRPVGRRIHTQRRKPHPEVPGTNHPEFPHDNGQRGCRASKDEAFGPRSSSPYLRRPAEPALEGRGAPGLSKVAAKCLPESKAGGPPQDEDRGTGVSAICESGY
jgi:hypothetical protein